MSEKTYIELCKNSKRTIQINIWNDAGVQVSPSGAYYEIKGSKRDNIVVSRRAATVNGNAVYARITTSVTASATEYDVYWDIHTSDTIYHCTKLLVIDTC